LICLLQLRCREWIEWRLEWLLAAVVCRKALISLTRVSTLIDDERIVNKPSSLARSLEGREGREAETPDFSGILHLVRSELEFRALPHSTLQVKVKVRFASRSSQRATYSQEPATWPFNRQPPWHHFSAQALSSGVLEGSDLDGTVLTCHCTLDLITHPRSFAIG